MKLSRIVYDEYQTLSESGIFSKIKEFLLEPGLPDDLGWVLYIVHGDDGYFNELHGVIKRASETDQELIKDQELPFANELLRDLFFILVPDKIQDAAAIRQQIIEYTKEEIYDTAQATQIQPAESETGASQDIIDAVEDLKKKFGNPNTSQEEKRAIKKQIHKYIQLAKQHGQTGNVNKLSEIMALSEGFLDDFKAGSSFPKRAGRQQQKEQLIRKNRLAVKYIIILATEILQKQITQKLKEDNSGITTDQIKQAYKQNVKGKLKIISKRLFPDDLTNAEKIDINQEPTKLQPQSRSADYYIQKIQKSEPKDIIKYLKAKPERRIGKEVANAIFAKLGHHIKTNRPMTAREIIRVDWLFLENQPKPQSRSADYYIQKIQKSEPKDIIKYLKAKPERQIGKEVASAIFAKLGTNTTTNGAILASSILKHSRNSQIAGRIDKVMKLLHGKDSSQIITGIDKILLYIFPKKYIQQQWNNKKIPDQMRASTLFMYLNSEKYKLFSN